MTGSGVFVAVAGATIGIFVCAFVWAFTPAFVNAVRRRLSGQRNARKAKEEDGWVWWRRP